MIEPHLIHGVELPQPQLSPKHQTVISLLAAVPCTQGHVEAQEWEHGEGIDGVWIIQPGSHYREDRMGCEDQHGDVVADRLGADKNNLPQQRDSE